MHRLLRRGILITFGILITCIITGCGDDDAPEKVTDPPQSEDRVQPPRATKVEVVPAGGTVSSNQAFTLTFNQEVIAVWCNDTPAVGSGLNWKVAPVLGQGDGQILNIKWENQDGSMDTIEAGPYSVEDGGHGEPPLITGGTVADGDVDVDPALINAAGLRYDFDEDVTGAIKLTDEAGNDLNWIASVAGSTATLTPVAGQELANETIYNIEISVADGSENKLDTRITFVTKPK